MKKPEKKEKEEKDGKKLLDSYIRYSSAGIQMAVIIGGCVWLGDWLDERNEKEFPLYTVILSLFGVFMALYVLLKSLLKKK